MNFKLNIRQTIAIFLLLVFALGATPKKFIHDAIAMHQHHYEIKCSHHHINISSTSFNCQIDNLVVEMPFVAALQPIFNFVATTHFIHSTQFYNNIVSANVCVVCLRGPPAC